MSIVYIFLALISLLFYYVRFKDIFHPNLIFLVIWFSTCSISCVNFNDFLRPWCLEMYFVTIISGIAFGFGSILGDFTIRVPRRVIKVKIETSYSYKFVLYILFFLCMSCCIAEWLNGGGIIVIGLDVANGDMKSQLDGDIAGIHYGTILLPYLAVLAYFKWINSSRKSRFDVFIIVSIVLTSFLFRASRGDMLIYILAFFFIYTRYYKIGLYKIIAVVLLLVLIIIGFMLLRVDETSIVMTATDNPYFSIFYTYIATCYANLNDLIRLDLPYHFIGDATFSPLWTLTGLYSYRDITLVDQMGVFNAVTYLYNFYHDYKLGGVIIFPLLIGLTISLIYKKTMKGSPYWILLLAALQKAIFTPFFGNYFFGDFVAFFPFLFIAFFILFLLSYNIKSLK